MGSTSASVIASTRIGAIAYEAVLLAPGVAHAVAARGSAALHATTHWQCAEGWIEGCCTQIAGNVWRCALYHAR